MDSFESVGKAAEEAAPTFVLASFSRDLDGHSDRDSFLRQHRCSSVFVAPWRQLTGEKFMTAVAFRQALGAQWIVQIILAALCCRYSNAPTEISLPPVDCCFALGRRGMVDPRRAESTSPASDAVSPRACIGFRN